MKGSVLFLFALIAYAAIYWAMQPTCRNGEVRVRGLFMTACVPGRGGMIP